jgi:hypothetical protein
MSQRGIRKALIELAYAHGEPSRDKLVLSRSACHDLLAELDAQRSVLQDAIRKDGVTLVVDGPTVITTYRGASSRA